MSQATARESTWPRTDLKDSPAAAIAVSATKGPQTFADKKGSRAEMTAMVTAVIPRAAPAAMRRRDTGAADIAIQETTPGRRDLFPQRARLRAVARACGR
jgi:hypothetical protein